jgi:putative SOS response-associated peptidase YedK
MCNLYSLTRSREAILRLFRVSDNRAPAFIARSAIFPGYTAPVVRTASDSERELVLMSWGFVLPQAGKAHRRVTSVRDDKILASRFWRPPFEQRRCFVPASSYSEPNAETPAKWVWFAVNSEDERRLFAFPGIWQRWNGPIKKDGPAVEVDAYAFMTTAPNDLTRGINQERMPVLLSEKEEFETWLRGAPDEAMTLVRSFDPDAMRIVQSGFDKEDLLGAPAREPGPRSARLKRLL